MDRRSFVLGMTVSTASGFYMPAHAVDEDKIVILSELPPLPLDLKDKSTDQPAAYQETTPVGTAKPSNEEVSMAYDILINSPYSTSPIDVAEYLLSVGLGAFGRDMRPFAREWPVRANPLIFHLFSSTQTKPEGDTTAWCAAFVNWCILRSHAEDKEVIGISPGSFSKAGKPFSTDDLKKYSTNSASSGSFRCWEKTESPKRGDLVVFKNAGTDALTKNCIGTGHIAFFIRSPSANIVQVLGGNQSSPGSNGAVTIANMSAGPNSRFMKFVNLKNA